MAGERARPADGARPAGSGSLTPIQDAARAGAGVDLLVAQERAEASARVATSTKHGELTAGVAVRKWYDGPLEYFGFASWRPRRK